MVVQAEQEQEQEQGAPGRESAYSDFLDQGLDIQQLCIHIRIHIDIGIRIRIRIHIAIVTHTANTTRIHNIRTIDSHSTLLHRSYHDMEPFPGMSDRAQQRLALLAAEREARAWKPDLSFNPRFNYINTQYDIRVKEEHAPDSEETI